MIKKKCEICGKKFDTFHNKKYCSKTCSKIAKFFSNKISAVNTKSLIGNRTPFIITALKTNNFELFACLGVKALKEFCDKRKIDSTFSVNKFRNDVEIMVKGDKFRGMKLRSLLLFGLIHYFRWLNDEFKIRFVK